MQIYSIFYIFANLKTDNSSMNPDFDEHVAREGTYCVKYDLRQEVFGKENIIPMWVADMDFKTPDFVTSAIKNRVEHEIFGYSIRPHQYYSSIIDWIQERHGWKIEKDWICFTPGVVPALNFCTLAFTNPGDSIIVQPPVYFPFFSAVESHGRKLIYNRLKENNGRWEMDFDNLESVIKPDTRMIIISNPHNPIGRVWRKEELEKLANLCLKNNIIIVSDEIHCDLVLPGYRHTPLASLSPDISSLTVTLTAPSKTFNLAGLSTSSVIIESKKLRQSFTNVTEKLHTGYGNLFGTIASIAAYSYGHEWLDSLLFYLQENINMVERFCMDNLPEIRPVHPEATYMIWLDCRKSGIDEKKLHDFFISNASVGMNEGSTFGPGGEGFMRMNIGTQRSIVLKALNQIKTAFSETMKNNERNNKG